MAEDTPLFAQYKNIKAQHPNEVLFFRLGDFYEMFGDDAVEVSRLLNLTLTHRGQDPMCGVPYHAAKIYIARLLRLGKKIAVAEQIGEIAKHGGLTERKVVEIITPGTAVEAEYLDGGANNYLASFVIKGNSCAYAFIDVTTGEFKATSFSLSLIAENLPKELGRVNPKELILPVSLRENSFVQECLVHCDGLSVSYYPDWDFDIKLGFKHLTEQFKTKNLASFSLDENSPEVSPAGFLLDYILKTTNTHSPHVKSIKVYHDSDFVIMDDSSRRNLEITENLQDRSRQFTLLECLDSTCTSMGSRMLRNWLMFPLCVKERIESRLDSVSKFVDDRSLFYKVRTALDGILDIERLASRIAMDRAHAKDLVTLASSLSLWKKASLVLNNGDFKSDEIDSIVNMISSAILDDPSTSLTEGGIIKSGWSKELDKWRDIHENFSKVLDEYTEEEKERTGIQNLRIKKSGNMGYFIEVTKGKLDKVPPHFIIRRSLVNAERYTTEKLQALEQDLNDSSSKILELERDLFLEIRNSLKAYVPLLQDISVQVAYTDVTSTFADVAIRQNWVRPVLSESGIFVVKDARHPVVEKHIESGEFIPNDLSLLNEDEKFFALITGPNMAGKSTYLRQNALIALLSQTGSFVPASFAEIGIIDRIFCRVGASDNLARGESTFLVEMTETARILRNATERSLVIMDEVGRGTSTEDGLSIARAVSEYIMTRIKCKTLFATHYHELTRLSSPCMKKLCMAVEEKSGSVVFLRKVIPGAAKNSFGLHVARLAGLPEPVINRAKEFLEVLQKEKAVSENGGEYVSFEDDELELSASTQNAVQGAAVNDGAPTEASFNDGAGTSLNESAAFTSESAVLGAAPSGNLSASTQKGFTAPSLFSDEELILDEILSCDVNTMTPIDALKTILRWKQTLQG